MRKIKWVIRLLVAFLKGRPVQTLYINFKCLPVKQALRLPIFINSKVVFRHLYRGGVIIDCQAIRTNMIRIGSTHWYPITAKPQTVLNIEGKLVFRGPVASSGGIYILVAKGATLSIGTNGTFIGCGTRILCYNNVEIGNSTHITWDVQIMDSSFHYVENESGETSRLDAPVFIGDFCWVGNRSTITKGANLPDYTIVASNSLVNKDFSSTGGAILLAGSPATVKASHVKRIFDEEIEARLDARYGYHRTHI